MFDFILIAILLMLLVTGGIYAWGKYSQYKWERVADGIWRQKQKDRYNTTFTYITSGSNVSSSCPCVWLVKSPWANTKYISQHQTQLQRWWGPLQYKYAALNNAPKKEIIKHIGYSPDLGLTLKIEVPKRAPSPSMEYLIIELLNEAHATWEPKRFEVDPTYGWRKSLAEYMTLLFVVPAMLIFFAIVKFKFIGFFDDPYYIASGIIIGAVMAVAVIIKYSPTFDKSLFKWQTIGWLSALVFAFVMATVPYTLAEVNRSYVYNSCDIDAPVQRWFMRSGKNRSYHVTLDVSKCSLSIPSSVNMQVNYASYQQSNSLSVRASKGLLGRYFVEFK